MNKTLNNENGVALVVTLAIVAILTTAALQMGKFTSDSVLTTSIDKNRFEIEQLAISGIHLASLILVDDAKENSIDSVQEDWADPDKLAQAVNELGLDKETLTIKITDELSKLQANAFIQQFPGNQLNTYQSWIWENFLTLKFSHDSDVDKRDPAEIMNPLKDWLDSQDDDAITGLSGAESDYYQELYPPYQCANGPLNHIDELLNVKGFSKDLLTPPPSDQTDERLDEIELNEVFTIYGLDNEKGKNGGFRYAGKININTAETDVLASLLPVGFQEMAQDLADFREQKGEQEEIFLNRLDKGWYKEVIELSQKEQTRLDRIIRYNSDTFKVECTATKNAVNVTLVAFLKREKNNESGKWMCRIIQMERK